MLLGLMVALAACGGGDGGGGGGPVSPPSGISFTATGGATTNGLVLVQSINSTPNLLRLDFVAQGMTNLYGVAFDVLFPSEILNFTVATQGAFLGGTGTSLQFEQTAPGRLVVGMSRLGNAPGASGSGVVLSLEFASRGAAGSGTFRYERNSAFTPTGAPISGVTWGGGSVTVTP